MRLELGHFPVRDARFAAQTRWRDGVLEIDREAVLAAVRQDPLVGSVSLEIARPGEPTRIWPVRDVIEPRVKVRGPGVVYPGWFGRPVETVGAAGPTGWPAPACRRSRRWPGTMPAATSSTSSSTCRARGPSCSPRPGS